MLYHPHPRDRRGEIKLLFKPETTPGMELKEVLSISAGAELDLTGDLILGRYVMIGRGSQILTHDHIHSGRKPLLPRNAIVWKNKIICEDVWIHGAIILMQCDFIAKGVIIGAGSVITKPITEEYGIWVGNPGRKIGSR